MTGRGRLYVATRWHRYQPENKSNREKMHGPSKGGSPRFIWLPKRFDPSRGTEPVQALEELTRRVRTMAPDAQRELHRLVVDFWDARETRNKVNKDEDLPPDLQL